LPEVNRVRGWAAAALLILLLVSCGPKAAPALTPTPGPSPAPTATPVPHAAAIRFALIGALNPANVWALFDAEGYSYNTYAVMSGYYPRLYQLSIPDRNFEPMAAGGMPSPVEQEGNFYTATVPLRSDLTWTDGSPFTAEDVAFTVNTALSFQLGFDWHDFYDPDYLDHAEAADAHTVKFYFKKQPNVGVWQYGALQGPIVQKAYWSSKLSAAAALLPSSELLPQIASLTSQAAQTQSEINELYATLATLANPSTTYLETTNDIKGQQDILNQTNTAISKAQSQYDTALDAARQSLYALDGQGEPTLGDWMPAGPENGAWVNTVNPAHPFNVPHFDRSAYVLFSDQTSALAALENDQVDLILSPGGIAQDVASQKIVPPLQLADNRTSSVSFIRINSANAALADPAFRQALSCMIDNVSLGRYFMALPQDTFVPAGNQPWINSAATNPCQGQAESDRRKHAADLLKAAGYTWQKEPTEEQAGQGLMRPDGMPFPKITLLSADRGENLPNVAEAIEQMAGDFGIPLIGSPESAQDVRYKVFSGGDYDMAALDWQLSAYPSYLCDWFKDGNSFGYQSDQLQSACAALNATSDLSAAQKDVDQIQSILAHDLPLIPLYASLTDDAYRNIKYPFRSVLDGLSGVYGAPSLAIPAP